MLVLRVTTAGTVTTVILAQPELEVRLVLLVLRVTLVIPEMMALTERLVLQERLAMAMLAMLAMLVTLAMVAEEEEGEEPEIRVTEN